jgi:cold shock CspA family protein
MQVPVRIVLKDVPNTAGVRAQVVKAAEVLERFHDRITACRVAVTNPDTRHRTGGLYDVHVVLRVPGHDDIAVSRRAGDQGEREHLPVALRKAFAQARRRLQDAVRGQRNEVKTHVPPQATGRVARLFARAGYGIIEDTEGREVYFHRNSVAGGRFADLAVGTQVRFVEQEGEKGPQASTVIVRQTRRVTRAANSKAPRAST